MVAPTDSLLFISQLNPNLSSVMSRSENAAQASVWARDSDSARRERRLRVMLFGECANDVNFVWIILQRSRPSDLWKVHKHIRKSLYFEKFLKILKKLFSKSFLSRCGQRPHKTNKLTDKSKFESIRKKGESNSKTNLTHLIIYLERFDYYCASSIFAISSAR